MADDVANVLKVSVLSRVITLIVQAILNGIVEDYDSSAVVNNKTTLENVIVKTLSGMAKWDSVYFLEIAEKGYLYEQYMAFFPLYPMTIRGTVIALCQLLPVHLKYQCILLLSSLMINLISFTFAAILMYKLTFTVFRNRQMAIISSILFCVNPATIFMSAAYSESLFACLQFSALYFLESGGSSSYLLASLLFCMGSATRANGIVSAGFITHSILKQLLNAVYLKTKQPINYKSFSFLFKCFLSQTAGTFTKLMIYNGIVISPFVLFQFYGYSTYCNRNQEQNLQSPWCSETYPMPYSYIQSHYWNVGFLKYFEFKQIPNFLLAVPILILSLCSFFCYCVNEDNKLTVKTLGLISPNTWQETKHLPRQVSVYNDEFNQPKVFVYLVHLLFLTMFGFTSMHVQVITRFICSSSPAVYWFSAHVFLKESKTRSVKSGSASTFIIGYFVLYFFIGIALHCNFYPWT